MRRSPLFIVYLTVFIDLLGFGIILPLLPFYAEDLGASGLLFGLLLTSYSAAQFLAAPVIGRLSDKYGRRPLLLVGLAGSAISLTVTGLAGTLLLLLVGRILAGLFGGTISAAQAYIADVSRPEERAKYMGFLGASIGLGFVFGPALGAGLSPFGFGTAAYVAAALAAGNLVFAFFKLSESKPVAGVEESAAISWKDYRAAIQTPAMSRILSVRFLTMFAFVAMETTFALFGKEEFGLTAVELGIVFAFIGLVMIAVQGGLIGKLTDIADERTVASAGVIIMALALLAIPLSTNLALASLCLGALAVGQGLVTPTLASMLSLTTHQDQQGGMLGIGQSIQAMARLIGPISAGFLFDIGIGLPFIIGGLLSAVAAGLLIHFPVSSGSLQPDSQEAD